MIIITNRLPKREPEVMRAARGIDITRTEAMVEVIDMKAEIDIVHEMTNVA